MSADRAVPSYLAAFAPTRRAEETTAVPAEQEPSAAATERELEPNAETDFDEVMWIEGWDDYLRSIELELAWSIQDRIALATPWEEPVGLGPLPLRFVPRANRIITLLGDLNQSLSAVQDDILQQMGAIERVPKTHVTATSVYLDAIG